jgi:hypothetical protein
MRPFFFLAQVVLLSGTRIPFGYAQTPCGMPQGLQRAASRAPRHRLIAFFNAPLRLVEQKGGSRTRTGLKVEAGGLLFRGSG